MGWHCNEAAECDWLSTTLWKLFHLQSTSKPGRQKSVLYQTEDTTIHSSLYNNVAFQDQRNGCPSLDSTLLQVTTSANTDLTKNKKQQTKQKSDDRYTSRQPSCSAFVFCCRTFSSLSERARIEIVSAGRVWQSCAAVTCCLNYSISNFPTVSFKECVTKSYKVRKAMCEHTAHTSKFKRRQNHTHLHRKLHRKFKISKGKEV